MLLAASPPIELWRLALMALPVSVVLAILWRWRLGAPHAAYSVCRMLVQLSLIGYVLKGVFKADEPWIVLGVMGVMVTVAAWIALRTLPGKRSELYPKALLAILVGGGFNLLLVTQGVLQLEPWYEPKAFVPIAAMIFTAAMNAVSLAAERFAAERRSDHDYRESRHAAMQAALLPAINSLLAVGLVSLPGFMTGQIIDGADPLLAARYQMMVMAMFFGSAGASASCYLWLLGRETASPNVPL